MTLIEIFVDDFVLQSVSPSSGATIDRYGFLAALVRHEHVARIDEVMRGELLAVRQVGIIAKELHGYDIASGSGSWRSMAIPKRIEIFRRVLEVARAADVHFIWEYIRTDDERFKDLRERVYDGLAERLPERHRSRWAPDADPRLLIASLLRRSSVLYALDRLNADRVTVYEDRGVPRDVSHDMGLFEPLHRRGLLAVRGGCDSAAVSGIQLADLASNLLRTALKVARNIQIAEETEPAAEFVGVDSFMANVIQSGVVDLLEMRTRTHRAVDLDIARRALDVVQHRVAADRAAPGR